MALELDALAVAGGARTGQGHPGGLALYSCRFVFKVDASMFYRLP
jgi:hypothetical protein